MSIFNLPQLNTKATEVFLKLLGKLPDQSMEQHVKIDNEPGTFMHVSFEFLHDLNFGPVKAKKYALAHYYEQNGDLVPDPDMTFICFDFKNSTSVLPVSYQSAIRFDECLFIEDNKWKVNKKLMYSMVDFSNTWLQNIADQQGI